MRCACLMTGKEKGLVCSSLFLQWSSGDLQDCIRQQGLVTEWLCRFHLETTHPRQNLFVVPHSSRDPIVLALGKMFVKRIWNCSVVKQYCCTLKDQRPAGSVVGLWELALAPFSDIPRAVVLPCWWWSSAVSGWDCHTLFFPVHFQSWLHSPGRQVANPAPVQSCHCLSLQKQAPLAIDTAMKHFPQGHHGTKPSLTCLYPQQVKL